MYLGQHWIAEDSFGFHKAFGWAQKVSLDESRYELLSFWSQLRMFLYSKYANKTNLNRFKILSEPESNLQNWTGKISEGIWSIQKYSRRQRNLGENKTRTEGEKAPKVQDFIGQFKKGFGQTKTAS